jgi:hypothetical protein
MSGDLAPKGWRTQPRGNTSKTLPPATDRKIDDMDDHHEDDWAQGARMRIAARAYKAGRFTYVDLSPPRHTRQCSGNVTDTAHGWLASSASRCASISDIPHSRQASYLSCRRTWSGSKLLCFISDMRRAIHLTQTRSR